MPKRKKKTDDNPQLELFAAPIMEPPPVTHSAPPAADLPNPPKRPKRTPTPASTPASPLSSTSPQAGRSTRAKAPVEYRTAQDVAQAIIKRIEHIQHGVGYGRREIFTDWLELIWGDVTCPTEGCSNIVPDHTCPMLGLCAFKRADERHKRLSRYERYGHELDEMNEILLSWYKDSREDVLGPIFMLMNLGGKGQFFTPWHVCRMMAMMTFDPHQQPDASGKIHMADPAGCGSGTMLLAMMDVVLTECPERFLDFAFYGVDIDGLCVLMSKVNIRIQYVLYAIKHAFADAAA